MSFYEGLSVKGNALLSFLQMGAKQDRSGISVLKALRDQDLGYRKKTFDKDYGIVQAAANKFDGMKHIGLDKRVGEHWYAKAGSRLTSQYQTVVEIRGIDTNTGELVTEHVTVLHDKILTRRELEEDALKRANETSPDKEYYYSRPVGARLTASLS